MHDTLQRAWQLYRFRRYALALEETAKFLGHYPESAEAFCLAALILGKEKRQKQALEAAEAAIRYMPDWSYPHYVHALVNYWFDMHDSALQSLSEALRIQPTDPDFYELVSSIHAEQGHINTSLEMADTGLAYYPEHVGCLYLRGLALFRLNKHQEAEAVFRNILNINPEHSPSLGVIGHYQVLQGKTEEALPLLRQSLRDNPESEFAQSAWKEVLRSKYPFYGSIVRLRYLMIDKYPKQAFLAIYLVVCPVFFILISPKPREMVYEGLMVIFTGAIIAALILLAFALLMTGYLQLVSRILLVADPELRRSFDWKEKLKEYRNFLYIFIGIMLGILIMALTSKSKP